MPFRAKPPLAAISDRERFLEAVLSSAIDYGIIAIDPIGLVTAWNEGARRILGWTEAEMLGHPASVFFTEEDCREGIPQREMIAALDEGRGTDERWHLRKDGSRFWANGEMMALRNADGQHLGFIKVLRDRTEQRLAAERQRADAEFLRSVLASSADCIKVLDLDAKLIFMSEGGQRVMEVSDFNAIKNCPWPDFWHGKENDKAVAAIEAAKAGRVGHFQGAAETMAGRSRFWDVQVTPILGANGKPDRLLSVSRDISATIQAERALQEAQSLSSLILESSRDCIVVLDIEGNTRFVSPGGVAAMEITDVEGIIGLSWPRVWDGEDHIAARAAVATAKAGGIGRFQGYCATHRGTPKWWDVVISPLLGEHGPVGLVSIARDVTAQRNAEAVLRETEEWRRLAIEAADIGTWSINPQTHGDLYWDDRCRALFGVDADAAVTYDTYLSGIHPNDVERVTMTTLGALDVTGSGSYRAEYRIVAPDGAERWISAAGRTHFEDGRAIRMVGTVRDVTARKRAEEQAQLLGDELQHRVKNTLSMVQAIVRQTLRSAATPADAQRAIDPRLTALARAHDMLTRGGWEGADIRSVVEAALLPHDDKTEGRFALRGPAAWLPAQAALSLALLLHELSTNASKYGALSVREGRISVSWDVKPNDDGSRQVLLVWREMDGPSVEPPRSRGFGSKLIERGLTSGLGGQATLTFSRTGVVCEVNGRLPASTGEQS